MVISWFILALLSVFALAGAELAQQHLLHFKNIVNERTSAVLTFLFQSLLTLPIILLSPYRSQLFAVFQPELLPRLVTVTMLASFAMIFYLRSFKVKNISISTIFVSCSTIVSTSLGILFLHESAYLLKFIGIFLVLVAIISLNVKNANLEKNHLYGLLAGLLFGITYTLDKSILLHVPAIIYIFWAFFLVSLFGFLFNPRNVLHSLKGKQITAFKPIVFSGFGYFLYNFFTFTAYKLGGEVGRIDAINNSQVFLIILFEFLILKHKTSFKRKLLTAVIAYIGVFILGAY